MVTFRFYVVSIVAFFLALAVGVVVGSVLDDGISRSLQSRVERLEGNLDENLTVIDNKNREIDGLDEFSQAVAPFAVEGRMAGASSLVVVEPGLDDQPVQDLLLRIRQAGAHAEGLVRLEPRWTLTNAEDRIKLAQILDVNIVNADALRETTWSQVLDAAAPETPGSVTSTTAAPTTTAGDSPAAPTTEAPSDGSDPTSPGVELFAVPLLVELQEAGFLRLVRLDGPDPEGGGALTVVGVTGADSDLDQPGSAAAELARTASSADLPTVLAEILPTDAAASTRGELVTDARRIAPAEFSTVDDLELVQGRVATVLALAEQRLGNSGHYGYGPEVDGVLPRWLGP